MKIGVETFDWDDPVALAKRRKEKEDRIAACKEHRPNEDVVYTMYPPRYRCATCGEMESAEEWRKRGFSLERWTDADHEEYVEFCKAWRLAFGECS